MQSEKKRDKLIVGADGTWVIGRGIEVSGIEWQGVIRAGKNYSRSG